MNTNLRVGVAQMECALGDVEENLRRIEGFLDQAVQCGVNLLLFPELALTGYLVRERFHEVATRLDGPVVARLRALSRKGVDLCLGFIEETKEAEFYNSSIYLSEGRIVHLHRKIYLPTYGRFDERRYFGAGKDLCAFDTRFGRMAMLICGDCWHLPLPYLAVHDGADILLVLAASSRQGLADTVHPRVAWQAMNRSYALCMGSFLIFANRAGEEEDLLFWGGSQIILPDGNSLSEGALDQPGFVVGDVDMAVIRKMRIVLPFRRDDRLDFTLEVGRRILLRSKDRQRAFVSELGQPE